MAALEPASAHQLRARSACAREFQGVVSELGRPTGLRVVQVAHPPGQHIAAHAHDWPCLTLHRCGSYVELSDEVELSIDRPAAVYRPAGDHHENRIGPNGLDTVSILFDPALMTTRTAFPLSRGRHWIGGAVGRLAGGAADALLAGAANPLTVVAGFLEASGASPAISSAPAWLARVEQRIAGGTTSTVELAADASLHPAWLAHAYLTAVGESIQATVRRRRAERALTLIRFTSTNFATIAADVGFCDQSHMVRTVRALLGRSPSALRAGGADGRARP